MSKSISRRIGDIQSLESTAILRECAMKHYDIKNPINAGTSTSLDRTPNTAALSKTGIPIFNPNSLGNSPEERIITLMHCASQGLEFRMDQVLAIYLNFCHNVMPGFLDSVGQIFNCYNLIRLENINWNEWQQDELTSYTGFPEGAVPESITPQHVAAMSGLYFCLIGKNLTPENAVNWISKRAMGFAQACSADPDTDEYKDLAPEQSFAAMVYAATSSRFELRRHIFKFIRAISTAESLWGKAFSVTMIMLTNVELTSFILCHKYILVENPILLAWNELARHAGPLYAAYKKWISMGDDAPYAKLLFPSSQLTEFHREELKILFAVAIMIATKQGQASLKNLKTSFSNDRIKNIVEGAERIYNHYGGAVTYEGLNIRKELLPLSLNETMLVELTRGAETEAITNADKMLEEIQNLAQ